MKVKDAKNAAHGAIIALQNVLLIPKEDQFPKIGPKTIGRLTELENADPEAEWGDDAPEAPPIPAGSIPQAAIDLILDAEGIDQPSRWPGGGSGITLGYGVDIGADPKSLEYWRGILSDDQIETLKQAKGITGRAAAQIASRFADIKVTKDQAMQVFTGHTLPTEIALTLKTFPGVENLPAAVLGALVSLVFNRGSAMTGERRREMRDIRDLIADYQPGRPLKPVLDAIADKFREMKRLWQGQGLPGLITRRENEAKLVESAA